MTDHQWGRSSDAGRQPTRLPAYTLMLFPLALVVGLGLAVYQHQVQWTTLQRWYLPSYLESSYMPREVMPTGTYQLVDLVDGRYVARSPHTYRHADIEPWLRDTVYDGYRLHELTYWPLGAAAIVLILGACLTVPLDRRRLQEIREGQILRGGARLQSPAEFNRSHRQHDGLRIRVE